MGWLTHRLFRMYVLVFLGLSLLPSLSLSTAGRMVVARERAEKGQSIQEGTFAKVTSYVKCGQRDC